MYSVRCTAYTKHNKQCKNNVIWLGNCLKAVCHVHKKSEIYLNKPEECGVCYESLENEKRPLCCGHWIHRECVRQHFKPECPICRAPVNIRVCGKPPEPLSDIPMEYSSDEENSDDDGWPNQVNWQEAIEYLIRTRNPS